MRFWAGCGPDIFIALKLAVISWHFPAADGLDRERRLVEAPIQWSAAVIEQPGAVCRSQWRASANAGPLMSLP